jgi:hypothetical protein
MAGAGFGGQAMRHDEFREWAAAALGDPRQVYARKADAPPEDPLVFMPDGEAGRFREAAKSGALICPVPQCPSPGLTTREYEDRRDHFMHVRAPGDRGHGQSYMRLATRRLLRDWVAEQDRVVKVRDGKLDGVSIAMLARLDDGRGVALCYVDKQMGADAWEERNDLHRSEGIAVAWIFALRKTFFAPPDPAEPEAEGRTDLILDRPIYKRMREKGSWPLLINLERQELANVIKPGGKPAQRLGLAPTALDRVQHLVASGLADCRLCPYGIATPAITEYTLELSSGNWRR